MKCLACENELEADFGLVTCQKCKTVFIIDVEGNIQHQDSQVAEHPGSVSTSSDTPDLLDPVLSEPIFEPDLGSFEESPAALTSLIEPTDTIDSGLAEVEANAPKDLLADVVDFGNQTGEEGALRYEIVIWEINTDQDRKELKKALKDPKFQWNEYDLIESVQSGRLTLRDVSPAKAIVLVKNLRSTKLKVKWKQNAF